MTAIVCALLSGAFFFFSTNLGGIWPLAWIAPMPVLWLAFGAEKSWKVALASYAAVALGASNLLTAYAGLFPWQAFAVIFIVPPALFALIVLGARVVARRVHPLAGGLVFATLWTSWDYLASFGPDGTAPSPSYSQVGAPMLIQSASLFGLWSITFLLGFVAAALALALRTRKTPPALLAFGLFALNAGFGALRMQDLPPTTHVVLIANDAIGKAAFAEDRATALKTIRAYADAARAHEGAQLIVLPEHFAVLKPDWRKEAARALQGAADATGAVVVAGLDDRTGRERHNIAWIFLPNTAQPLTYVKRKLVPGLESRVFTPGPAALALPGGLGIEICKDMDFPQMIRADAAALHVALMAVPAWDFGADAWPHARLALMRSVENGFAMARASRDGLLMLSDPYGRVTASRASGAGFVTLEGRLPRGFGATLHQRIGDAFAWLCVAASVLLLALAVRRW
jgi:apolipoprotein N-acyltransferase